jgi:curved DNA-binding protein CbpA
MTLYAILGIACDADQETVRLAYRTLARRYHPDMGTGSSSEKFREVTEAYNILGDPSRREEYDRSLGLRPIAPRVPVEPLMAQPEPLVSRGVRVPRAYRNSVESMSGLDAIFEELMRLFDDDPFFSPPWWF